MTVTWAMRWPGCWTVSIDILRARPTQRIATTEVEARRALALLAAPVAGRA